MECLWTQYSRNGAWDEKTLTEHHNIIRGPHPKMCSLIQLLFLLLQLDYLKSNPDQSPRVVVCHNKFCLYSTKWFPLYKSVKLSKDNATLLDWKKWMLNALPLSIHQNYSWLSQRTPIAMIVISWKKRMLIFKTGLSLVLVLGLIVLC